MIINAIIDFVFFLLGAIIFLLPTEDAGVTAYISGGMSALRTLIVQNNWWFPVDQFFYVAGIAIVLLTALGTWMLIRFIAHTLTLGNIK